MEKKIKRVSNFFPLVEGREKKQNYKGACTKHIMPKSEFFFEMICLVTSKIKRNKL